MNDYIDANRKLWDTWTALHVDSEFYDVEGFRRGDRTLQKVDCEELGDVTGRRLLHLQCHFGLDTLSLARMGAEVTGTDLSPAAIEKARELATDCGLAARFVCCDLYDLPDHLDGGFDIVYTSAGVLVWLPDLKRWAEIIAHYLRPGGTFYIREFHPFTGIFDNEGEGGEPRIRYPYFHDPEPGRYEDTGSYADTDAPVEVVSYEWEHPLDEVINELIRAGLRIEYLHEFPFTTYRAHPFLKQDADGLWRYPGLKRGLPLMFSLRARKPR